LWFETLDHFLAVNAARRQKRLIAIAKLSKPFEFAFCNLGRGFFKGDF
jgi:hypothetical protein